MNLSHILKAFAAAKLVKDKCLETRQNTQACYDRVGFTNGDACYSCVKTMMTTLADADALDTCDNVDPSICLDSAECIFETCTVDCIVEQMIEVDCDLDADGNYCDASGICEDEGYEEECGDKEEELEECLEDHDAYECGLCLADLFYEQATNCSAISSDEFCPKFKTCYFETCPEACLSKVGAAMDCAVGYYDAGCAVACQFAEPKTIA